MQDDAAGERPSRAPDAAGPRDGSGAGDALGADPARPLVGGCQCGAVRYEAGPPLAAYGCHCTECQAQSASAFGLSVVVEAETLRVAGETTAWVRDADGPTEVVCAFCPRCGTRLYHARPGADRVTVKGGSLDARAWLVPDGHIWVRSAQPWMLDALDAVHDEDDLIDGQPADYRGLIDRWAERGQAARALVDDVAAFEVMRANRP